MSEKEAIENAVDTEVVDEVVKTVDDKHDSVEESTNSINNDVENEAKNEEMVKEETSDVEQVPESATPESVEQSVTVEQSEKTISDEQAAAERDVAPEIVQETSSLESNESQEIKVDCDDEDDEDEVETEVATVVKKPKKTKFEIQRQIKRIATNVISVIIWIVGLLLLFMCASNLYQQVFNPGRHLQAEYHFLMHFPVLAKTTIFQLVVFPVWKEHFSFAYKTEQTRCRWYKLHIFQVCPVLVFFPARVQAVFPADIPTKWTVSVPAWNASSQSHRELTAA